MTDLPVPDYAKIWRDVAQIEKDARRFRVLAENQKRFYSSGIACQVWLLKRDLKGETLIGTFRDVTALADALLAEGETDGE